MESKESKGSFARENRDMRQPTYYTNKDGGDYIDWPEELDINKLFLKGSPGINFIKIPRQGAEDITIHAILWFIGKEKGDLKLGRWDTMNGWTLKLPEDELITDPLSIPLSSKRIAPKSKSDGSTADYYELPPAATELQHLISHKDMNAQMGEIFRATYRYGEVEHSEKMRDAKKIRFYIEAEIDRLAALEDKEIPL